MRLGQRLSGGVAGGLKRSRLRRDGDTLRLDAAAGEDAALLGETVERRLKTLAGELGLQARETAVDRSLASAAAEMLDPIAARRDGCSAGRSR